jgi:hypothetical protein
MAEFYLKYAKIFGNDNSKGCLKRNVLSQDINYKMCTLDPWLTKKVMIWGPIHKLSHSKVRISISLIWYIAIISSWVPTLMDQVYSNLLVIRIWIVCLHMYDISYVSSLTRKEE